MRVHYGRPCLPPAPAADAQHGATLANKGGEQDASVGIVDPRLAGMYVQSMDAAFREGYASRQRAAMVALAKMGLLDSTTIDAKVAKKVQEEMKDVWQIQLFRDGRFVWKTGRYSNNPVTGTWLRHGPEIELKQMKNRNYKLDPRMRIEGEDLTFAEDEYPAGPRRRFVRVPGEQ